MTHLVIGAGPSGLAAVKTFRQAGIDVEAVDRQPDIGGQWLYGGAASAVYASTHLISSKGPTAYEDFPMPADWPAYPHHAHALQYLRDYARHFDLMPAIRCGIGVRQLTRNAQGWRAEFDDGTTRAYQGVVIANGHLTVPEMPEISGRFDGQVMHAKDYRTPDLFAGRRVLIVGMGNTGCDIVVDAVHRAAAVLWSVRRGNHFVPKFLGGRPADEGGRRGIANRLPRAWRARLHGAVLRFVVGRPEQFGLPKPEHGMYDRTPIVNSLVLQHLGQGDVALRGPIREFSGPEVVFADGRRDRVDLVVFATGYRATFPFIEPGPLNQVDGVPHLHLNIFPPDDNGLYVAGLLEGAGIGWGGRALQAELIAAYVKARPDAVAAFRRAIAATCSRPRPAAQGESGFFVDYAAYRRDLEAAKAALR